MTVAVISDNTGATYSGHYGVESRESSPTTNYYGGGNIGRGVEIQTYGSGDRAHGFFYPTGLSNLVGLGATVSNVVLELYATEIGATFDIVARGLIVNSIYDQLTWDDRVTGTAWTGGGATSTSDRNATVLATASLTNGGSGYQAFSNSGLIAWVQAIVDGGTNYGLTVAPSNDTAYDGSYAFFTDNTQTDGQRPKLTVTYTTSSGVTGTVDVTTGNDTSAATGTTTVTGSLARTTANDTSSATGTTTVTGSGNVTTGNDTVVASGTVGQVYGTADITTADDTSAASGTTTILASASVTTGDDVATASGSVGSAVTGSANITTGDDTSNSSGTTTVIGSASVTTNDDTSAAVGTTTIVGTIAVTTGDDVSSANGYVGAVDGTADITTGNDTCVAYGAGSPASEQLGFWGNPYKKKQRDTGYDPTYNPLEEPVLAPTSEDNTKHVQIPKQVQEIISNVAKIENERKQRAALKAQLKAIEIQFKQEYADALKAEMIKNYLILVQEQEEQDIAFVMMAMVA